MLPSQQDPRKENTVLRPKKFRYKKAAFAIEPHARTLEECIADAWTATAAESGKRRQILEKESGASIVSHYRNVSNGMTFLEVLAFTPGMKALAAEVDFTQPSIEIESYAIKSDKGKELDLIQNLGFVGISKNHVVLIGTSDLRSPEIEAHLNWLLREATSTLTGGQMLRLANRILPSKEAQINTAKEIHFSSELAIVTKDAASGSKRLSPGGNTWSGIRALLDGLGSGMADVTSDIELSGLTEATPVDIDIILKWPRPKKNQRHTLMDKIATGLRHVDTEIDYEIKTKNGTLKKADFILEKPKSVHCKGERPVRDLLFEAIAKWLVELQSSGEVA
jgi:hypothetical protein